MITVSSRIKSGIRRYAAEQIVEFYIDGWNHFDKHVRAIFREASHLAARAASENAETNLVVSAFLFRPCHMLAAGHYSIDPWTGDSLLESGSYDWLIEHFGNDVAELIRLQTHIRRYLASVVPNYFSQLDTASRRQLFGEGGFMSLCEREAIANGRYFASALRLSLWIDQGIDKWMEPPEPDFFAFFVETALCSESRFKLANC